MVLFARLYTYIYIYIIQQYNTAKLHGLRQNVSLYFTASFFFNHENFRAVGANAIPHFTVILRTCIKVRNWRVELVQLEADSRFPLRFPERNSALTSGAARNEAYIVVHNDVCFPTAYCRRLTLLAPIGTR